MPYSWTWERFVCVDVGNGEVAFHNTQWNRFIRMHSNGKIDRSSECSRDFIPGGWSWERFKLKDVGATAKSGYGVPIGRSSCRCNMAPCLSCIFHPDVEPNVRIETQV